MQHHPQSYQTTEIQIQHTKSHNGQVSQTQGGKKKRKHWSDYH